MFLPKRHQNNIWQGVGFDSDAFSIYVGFQQSRSPSLNTFALPLNAVALNLKEERLKQQPGVQKQWPIVFPY